MRKPSSQRRPNRIDPRSVLVLRHRAHEPLLRKVLPWLAAERPQLFNAYQQTQTEKVEKAMLRMKYVASFIGHEGGKALFFGIYSIGKSKSMTYSSAEGLTAATLHCCLQRPDAAC